MNKDRPQVIADQLITARMRLRGLEQMNAVNATQEEHVARAVETMEVMAVIAALEQEAKDWVQTRAQQLYNEAKKPKDPEPTEESELPLMVPVNDAKKKSN